jgi:hypothetical protein
MKGQLRDRARGHRLLGPAQRLLDAAPRADVHGRPRAADRVRERGQPAHRAGLHAAARDRRALSLGASRGSSCGSCWSRASCCRSRAARWACCWPSASRARCWRSSRPAAQPLLIRPTPDWRILRSPDPHAGHGHRVRTAAGAARQQARHVGHAQGHAGRRGRGGRVALPAQGPRRRAGRAQLPAALRRRALRAQPPEPARHRHRHRPRQPRHVPARRRRSAATTTSGRSASTSSCSSGCARRRAWSGPASPRVPMLAGDEWDSTHVGRGAPGQGRRGHADVHERAVAGLLRDDGHPASSKAATSRGSMPGRRRPSPSSTASSPSTSSPDRSALGRRIGFGPARTEAEHRDRRRRREFPVRRPARGRPAPGVRPELGRNGAAFYVRAAARRPAAYGSCGTRSSSSTRRCRCTS